MLYLAAFLVPPLAVLLAGKPFQAIINLILVIVTALTVVGLLIPLAHALFVVHNHYADKRQERLVREMAKAQAVAQALQHRDR
ncbi:MAG TPA: YqaE/Pmp3 family membrane protein [Chloroflexota bacterium]|nr:YqaE/Pmp3 family membrane protein [Chloroflexota bacterium]